MAAVVAYAAYSGHDAYRAGLFTRPKMPDGAFSLSFKSGFRAILIDVTNEKRTRRYLATPRKDVPFYLSDTWSLCYPPDEEEKRYLEGFLKSRNFPGERLEAVCKIKVDNESIERGLITSVPNL